MNARYREVDICLQTWLNALNKIQSNGFFRFHHSSGLEIATDTVASETNIFSLATIKKIWFSCHIGDQISLLFRFKLKE